MFLAASDYLWISLTECLISHLDSATPWIEYPKMQIAVLPDLLLALLRCLADSDFQLSVAHHPGLHQMMHWRCRNLIPQQGSPRCVPTQDQRHPHHLRHLRMSRERVGILRCPNQMLFVS